MSGTVATENPLDEPEALDATWRWIECFDRSCNRFRADSEISLVNQSGGGTFDVSEIFAEVLHAARVAHEMTNGLCDPTVLTALESLGYDRDYDEISHQELGPRNSSGPARGSSGWHVDVAARVLTVASGTRLDLGASAKALLADTVVAELATRGGALLEIGGDVSLRGDGPEGPWAVGLATSLSIRGTEPRVSLLNGGIATSSTTTRIR